MSHNKCPWCGYDFGEFTGKQFQAKHFVDRSILKHVVRCGFCGNTSRVKISIPFILCLLLLMIPLANLKTNLFFVILSVILLSIALIIYFHLPYVPYHQENSKQHEFIEREVDFIWVEKAGWLPPKIKIWDDAVLITNGEFEFGKDIKPFIIIKSFSSLEKRHGRILIPSQALIADIFDIVDSGKVIAHCKITE